MSCIDTPSQWDKLLREAFRIIDYVNRDHDILTWWTFGGGTALMLQIDHRESHDIDLFIDDPQLLPYVTAAVSDLDFVSGVPAYSGDGARHLKVAFDQIGEIDFIVAGQMTNPGAEPVELLGKTVALETVAEIVAKKVRFRGASIQPRDIFDIAAAVEAGFEKQITFALDEIDDYRATALARLEQLNEDYVSSIVSQLMIKPGFREMAKNAYQTTKRILIG